MNKSPTTRDNIFDLLGSKDLSVEITLAQLTKVCLNAHDRSRAPDDPRLILPVFVLNMIRLALKFTLSRQAAFDSYGTCL